MTTVLARSAVIPLNIDQGATFRWTVNYVDTVGNPVDLSGRSAMMQIRSATSGYCFWTLTAEQGGGITLNAANELGRIDIYLSPAQTQLIVHKNCNYDLIVLVPGGDVIRICEGTIYVDPACTIV
jgi:hypothetical protein